jgi:hypothetical protein
MIEFQSFESERIATCVGSYGHAASIRMPIALVRSRLTEKVKAVATQGSDKLSCSE